MRRLVPALIASSLVALAAEARADVVLVYEIHDARLRGGLAEEAIAELSGYLTAKITSGPVFTAIPRERVVAGLVARSLEGGEICQTEKCRLDLARELAADRVLTTEILRAGERCAVSSLVVDVISETSERGATALGACTRGALIDGIDRVVSSLKRQTRAARGQDPGAPDEPEPEEPIVEGEFEDDEPVDFVGTQLDGPDAGAAPDTSAEDVRACDAGDAEACGRASWALSQRGEAAEAERLAKVGCRKSDGA
ncbi:hypothetical protein L6R52_36520, partial [Myxococcota bacterium]|nr:hypothetical protein [Myxococcota bacterium]